MAKKKVDIKKETTIQNDNDKMNTKDPKIKQQNIPPVPDTMQMFASKKDRGFIAMTQEASMRADESAKERRSKASGNLPARLGNCIHKIREDS